MSKFLDAFGGRTPTGEAILKFAQTLNDTDANEYFNAFIQGSGIAIISNGPEPQPYADILSLKVYTITGAPAYRTTVDMRELDKARHALAEDTAGMKLIVVDRFKNDANEGIFAEEFRNVEYRLSGVLYFSPFPVPYAREILTAESAADTVQSGLSLDQKPDISGTHS